MQLPSPCTPSRSPVVKEAKSAVVSPLMALQTQPPPSGLAVNPINSAGANVRWKDRSSSSSEDAVF